MRVEIHLGPSCRILVDRGRDSGIRKAVPWAADILIAARHPGYTHTTLRSTSSPTSTAPTSSTWCGKRGLRGAMPKEAGKEDGIRELQHPNLDRDPLGI